MVPCVAHVQHKPTLARDALELHMICQRTELPNGTKTYEGSFEALFLGASEWQVIWVRNVCLSPGLLPEIFGWCYSSMLIRLPLPQCFCPRRRKLRPWSEKNSDQNSDHPRLCIYWGKEKLRPWSEFLGRANSDHGLSFWGGQTQTMV